MNARSSSLPRLPLLIAAVVPLCAGALACGAQVLDVGSTGKPGDTTGTAPGTGNTSGASPGASSDPNAWFPSSACTAVGPTAKLLYTPAPTFDVRNLTPDGEQLWFDSYDFGAQTANGHLASLPVAGGAPTPLELTGFRGMAGIFGGQQLVYIRITHEGNGTKEDPRREEVVLRDRTTGATTVLPNPRSTTYVEGVRVHPTGIYWTSREWDAMVPSAISRWDTATSAELTNTRNYSSVVTDGKDVFYTRWDDHGGGAVTDITFEAVPVSGGTPRVLRHMVYDQKFHYGIVAIDDAEVYFTQESLINGSTIDVGDLRAIKKDGSGERLLVSGQKYGFASFRVDPDYVMWTDQDAQQTIVRVHRTGGALERIVPGAANRWVSALAVDTCNIYWAVENPPAIYARSRLP
jgi:hypothetical protein